MRSEHPGSVLCRSSFAFPHNACRVKDLHIGEHHSDIADSVGALRNALQVLILTDHQLLFLVSRLKSSAMRSSMSALTFDSVFA